MVVASPQFSLSGALFARLAKIVLPSPRVLKFFLDICRLAGYGSIHLSEN